MIGDVTQQAVALLIVRSVVGSVFVLHGSQKVLGAFGGSGLVKFAGWIRSMGLPGWLGHVASCVEFFGGIMLLAGIMVPAVAAILAVNMAVAWYLVHAGRGYFIQNNGFEYVLNLLLLCIALMIAYWPA